MKHHYYVDPFLEPLSINILVTGSVRMRTSSPRRDQKEGGHVEEFAPVSVLMHEFIAVFSMREKRFFCTDYIAPAAATYGVQVDMMPRYFEAILRRIQQSVPHDITTSRAHSKTQHYKAFLLIGQQFCTKSDRSADTKRVFSTVPRQPSTPAKGAWCSFTTCSGYEDARLWASRLHICHGILRSD